MGQNDKKTSPYLLPGRLPDVIAALQVLSMHQNSEWHVDSWALILSKDKSEDAVKRWSAVFEGHPEFFLYYKFDKETRWKAALRLRYTNKSVDPKTGFELSVEERSKLTNEQRGKLKSHPLSVDLTEMLVSTAIDLHAREIENKHHRRWWQPLAISVVTTLIGGAVTLAGVWITLTHSTPKIEHAAVVKSPPKITHGAN